MIPSIPLSVALTVLFAGTGCYSLLRWASLRAGAAGHHGDQVAELSHLVMSLAMIGMVWGYGGPVADTVQLVAFGGFSCYFLGRLALGRLALGRLALGRLGLGRLGLGWLGLGRWRPARPGCPAPGFHLLMAGSMVWMVAAMPLLMAGMSTGVGGGGMVMDGMVMGGDAGPSGPVVTETPGWALALTVLFSIGLLVGAGYWARQLLPARASGASSGAAEDDLPPVEFGNQGPVAAAENQPPVQLGNHRPVAAAENLPPVEFGNEGPGGGGTATATLHAPAAPRVRGRVLAALTPRADASCHLAMSLGMVAMFLVML
ncbi:MAG TPA: DUF5134 domain-containing protein [Pseudonocardia sp.]|nr:DUF5134 domain-containing protein [Pseudonocardia sp.]